jgi:hypothetical protein
MPSVTSPIPTVVSPLVDVETGGEAISKQTFFGKEVT